MRLLYERNILLDIDKYIDDYLVSMVLEIIRYEHKYLGHIQGTYIPYGIGNYVGIGTHMSKCLLLYSIVRLMEPDKKWRICYVKVPFLISTYRSEDSIVIPYEYESNISMIIRGNVTYGSYRYIDREEVLDYYERKHGSLIDGYRCRYMMEKSNIPIDMNVTDIMDKFDLFPSNIGALHIIVCKILHCLDMIYSRYLSNVSGMEVTNSYNDVDIITQYR
jgi:hypothetical protein